MKYLFHTLLIFLVSLASCKKYQDDNFLLTTCTPEERVTQKWDVTMVIENGQDRTDDFVSYSYNFQENGRVIKNFDTLQLGDTLNVVEYGNWRLEENDNELFLTFENTLDIFEILELTDRNFSLKSQNQDRSIYYYMTIAN